MEMKLFHVFSMIIKIFLSINIINYTVNLPADQYILYTDQHTLELLW